jgi:hypothetical protein
MLLACCSQVPESLRQNTRYNQRYVNPGANFVMLNGMLMEVKNFELYSECHAHHSSFLAALVCVVGKKTVPTWINHMFLTHNR